VLYLATGADTGAGYGDRRRINRSATGRKLPNESAGMDNLSDNKDIRVRLATFAWLQEQVAIHGDVLPFELLHDGLQFEGTRVPMLGPQGIFKPAVLAELPLSITTAPDGPYDDSFAADGLLSYRYRGTDPRHRDNVGLRKAMQLRVPLVYFHGVAKGRYLAVWPVFIVGDDPARLTFTVAADDAKMADAALQRIGMPEAQIHDADGRRAYVTASVRVRLHQRTFRERVLHAYRDQCSLCRLRHRDLLDAAHIITDKEPSGEPLVTNGLALCKLHHAAFDHYLIGIRPDYVVEVQPRVLEESDGPMLRHGLQGLHNSTLILPGSRRDRPDPGRLAERYGRFISVA
jgi:putative restriction endonuclease